MQLLVGECYMNFSKLLQSEMRQHDKRNSSIMQGKISISMKKNLSMRTGKERDSLMKRHEFS